MQSLHLHKNAADMFLGGYDVGAVHIEADIYQSELP